ncbi:1-(5-phosphoribosyl)-5-[(5-phosphoribosylamino)methylideneamino] imidazole-4-carboxamide isomerase [Polystyrenella longa]|uniref:1-(5-phosphoribosyl)-5-[(5-phosphoribosylamino)methylideneamino] imidazole-4-carboxamide isomerase n=1 Tax=Polystyrenella longa TaxID=2528007 RepID=A0A518CP63_9PLAN|nr:HisA/HisF-related TIM barrel protein [Polystyrenella longa]QDU81003.1 1-(5-phosphoribosyl)-5-[(5-phosphoribosylamino)methylideneamino] imidazole-4-carboxamide isomerase [Polystyrenella longa]
MKIIPVLDLKGGQVVRGIAGQRETYQPLQSPFSASSGPVELATAIFKRFGLNHFYLADLDALGGEVPSFNVYQTLTDAGFLLDVDAGCSHLEQIEALFKAGVQRAIIAMETLTEKDFLARAAEQFGGERLLFSLDLRQGMPVSAYQEWQNQTPLEIVREVVEFGIQQIIVLDIAAVGTGSGLTTGSLCQQIATQFPNVELISGGGIRTAAEAQALADQGVISGLLISSLLHQEKLTRDQIDAISTP